MNIPNKNSARIAVSLDPGFAVPDDGDQAVQFFLIPNSEHYTKFSIMLEGGGGGVIGGIYGSVILRGFTPGVVGGAGNNTLALPSNYKTIYYSRDGTTLTVSGAAVNTFDLPTHLGGIVVGLSGLTDDGVLYVMMSGSAHTAESPAGA